MEQDPVCLDPTWACIKTYFRPKDITCMKPRGIKLDDCQSVKDNADDIYDRVSDGSMPMGGPAWTKEMCDNFKKWSETPNPCA